MDGYRYRRKIANRVLWIRLRNRWPFLVWLAALGLAAALYWREPFAFAAQPIHGVTEAEAVSIAPVETARIRRVAVAEGQRVRAGDLLVEMDTSLIAHGITADIIDIFRIRTAFGDTHQDVLQAVSQRLDAIAAIEAEIALCRQEQLRETAELEALRAVQEERERLRKQGLIDEMVRSENLPALAALERAVPEYARRMATLDRQLTEARAYHRAIVNWLGVRGEEPVSAAIERRLSEPEVMALLDTARSHADLYREAYVLRAPADAAVSQILYRPGDVVPAGIAIVRLVQEAAERVTAHVPEAQAGVLRPGMACQVRSLYRRTAPPVRATVERVSPEVHVSVFAASPTGRSVPVRSQRVLCRLDGRHDLLAGEAVSVNPVADRSLREWLAVLGL